MSYEKVTLKELEQGIYDDWIKGLNMLEMIPCEDSRAYLAQAMRRAKEFAIDYHNNDNKKIIDCYKVPLPDGLSDCYVWSLE